MVVPSELKAWANVRRLCTVAGGPRSEINGFATTCTTVMPAATMNRATKNISNTADEDAGMNRRHPIIISSRPTTALRM
jgi:hypothetical protein